jgi:AAA+ ATPase superfamily predicted ATPase
MIKTLTASRQLLIAENPPEIIRAIGILQEIEKLPPEIAYFSFIAAHMPRLIRIKEALLKIDAIERVESRRGVLHDQRGEISFIQAKVEIELFEPFNHIWAEGLKRCREILDREASILQGSAVLAIRLKNPNIMVSEEELRLYFEISNKGQELASNVTVSIDPVGPAPAIPLGSNLALPIDTGLDFLDAPDLAFSTGSTIGIPIGPVLKIDVIESGAVKEIFFRVKAGQPMESRINGTLSFTDRTGSDKKLPFSFPLWVHKRRAEFKKIENPYIIGQPLKGETPLFYGREDAHAFIDENILASGDHHTFVCYGLRRSGKTSLLYRIDTHGFTDLRLKPVYVDMQGIDDEGDFYATLARTIAAKISLHTAAGAAGVEHFSAFKGFLREIEPGLGDRIIVLMLDEFEELQMRVEDGRISRTIFSNIRHLMQHEEKLIFLFCGTHQIEEMAADYWSIFFNTAVYYRLSSLKREDALRLIQEPVKDRLTYDDLALEQILKMTGSQPYLVQLVCRTLVNHLNESKKRNDAMIDDVDDAVDSIIKEGKDHFSQYIRDEATTFERVVLSASAETLTLTQADHLGVEGIYEKIRTVSSAYSKKEMMETLEKLVSREILAERNMLYYFPVQMLRKWLAARFPLRKVREEAGG